MSAPSPSSLLATLLLATSLSLSLSPRTAQADCDAVWEVSALVGVAAERAYLGRDGRIVAILPQDWLRRISAIKEDIDSASGIVTRLFLCDSFAHNAFAYQADGEHIVMLTLGMYNLIEEDWDAYAALLGHENAHLVKGHGAQRRDRALTLTLAQILLGATVDSLNPKVIELGAGAFAASYSRSEEHEADLCGMVYAHLAGYDADGALRMHEKLASSSGFFSTHPSSAARIAALREGLELQAAARQARCK